MPTQQRFEGTDLEELLAEVRGTYGDDVAILEANKIRKGGVGGFFARELFEIVIDVDDDQHQPAPRRQPATLSATGDVEDAAASILDLVDRVDDGPAPRAGDDLAGRETIDRLMAKTADAPQIDPVDRVPMATGTESVQALLEEVRRTRGSGAGVAAGATATLSPDDPTLSTEGDAFAQLLGRIATSTESAATPPTQAAAVGGFEPYARTAPAATATTRARPTASAPSHAPAAAPSGQPTPVRGQRLARATATTVAERRPMVQQLGLDRLGLPAHYLDMAVPDGDRMGALMALADRFPQAMALPHSAASVIVLVGDRRGIQSAVEHVCSELQLDPGSLLLASRNPSSVFPEDRRITGGDEASARRLSFRRRQAPSLVVVDEPVGRLRSAWARQVVDALEPTAVWGVVEARAKTEDVVDWCEQLGGVDALALHGLDETTTPGTVLGTGLPVSLLDGRPATSARWAAVLDERLLAA